MADASAGCCCVVAAASKEFPITPCGIADDSEACGRTVCAVALPATVPCPVPCPAQLLRSPFPSTLLTPFPVPALLMPLPCRRADDAMLLPAPLVSITTPFPVSLLSGVEFTPDRTANVNAVRPDAESEVSRFDALRLPHFPLDSRVARSFSRSTLVLPGPSCKRRQSEGQKSSAHSTVAARSHSGFPRPPSPILHDQVVHQSDSYIRQSNRYTCSTALTLACIHAAELEHTTQQCVRR